MNIQKSSLWAILCLSIVFGTGFTGLSFKSKKPVIIGYVGGYNGKIVETSLINAKGLSHINYAFVDIKDNKAWLHHQNTDTVNFRKLNELKLINKDLKILISIGGWTWSKNFSDAVLTDSLTRVFAQSAVDIVATYNLDGVDIDWEYPGMRGDNNVYRAEDRENYTNLFKTLREQLDILGKRTGKKYLVTTAVGGSREFLQHTQMEIAQHYLDYINVMSYDFDGSYDNIAAHHSNVYSPPTMPYIYSADVAIQNLKAVGVRLSKVVMGVAFYGKGKIVAGIDNHGLYQKPLQAAPGGGYTYIKDSLMNQKGFVQYWDEESKAPYLFNAEKKLFITYDDEKSVKAKCDYIKKHTLAGVMFWEYFSDRKEYLLKVLNKELGYK